MSNKKPPIPSEIRYEKSEAKLYVSFGGLKLNCFSAEFLRVFSPSAEVRGHGQGQEILQVGKKDVQITAIEPVGNYGIKLVFDDSHDTGIYSWAWLHYLAENQDSLWQKYLKDLADAGGKRQASAPTNLK